MIIYDNIGMAGNWDVARNWDVAGNWDNSPNSPIVTDSNLF